MTPAHENQLRAFDAWLRKLFASSKPPLSCRLKKEANGSFTINHGKMLLEFQDGHIRLSDIGKGFKIVIIFSDKGLPYVLMCALHWAIDNAFANTYQT